MGTRAYRATKSPMKCAVIVSSLNKTLACNDVQTLLLAVSNKIVN